MQVLLQTGRAQGPFPCAEGSMLVVDLSLGGLPEQS